MKTSGSSGNTKLWAASIVAYKDADESNYHIGHIADVISASSKDEAMEKGLIKAREKLANRGRMES